MISEKRSEKEFTRAYKGIIGKMTKQNLNYHYNSYSTALKVSHESQSDSKFSQVSRTLLSILAGVNNAVVWMVSTCLLISKSLSPFINPLEIVPMHQLQLVSPPSSFSIVLLGL